MSMSGRGGYAGVIGNSGIIPAQAGIQ